MEDEAAATKDAGLMKRANDMLTRLCEVVDETDRRVAALMENPS